MRLLKGVFIQVVQGVLACLWPYGEILVSQSCLLGHRVVCLELLGLVHVDLVWVVNFTKFFSFSDLVLLCLPLLPLLRFAQVADLPSRAGFVTSVVDEELLDAVVKEDVKLTLAEMMTPLKGGF